MFSTWWPLLLVVASSVGYQVGLKEVSGIGDPMASLTVTYLAASVVSFVIYFFQSLGKESFLRGVLSVNLSAIGLGLAIVGIELKNSTASSTCICRISPMFRSFQVTASVS